MFLPMNYMFCLFFKVWSLLGDQQESAADLPATWAAQDLE